jgi:hypothetical protein
VTAKLLTLTEKGGDARHQDPVTAVREILADLESGAIKPDAMLVLFVDKGPDKFHVGFHNARLKASEIVTACEMMKSRAMAMLGYVYGPDNY